jgi:hypothetical protein
MFSIFFRAPQSGFPHLVATELLLKEYYRDTQDICRPSAAPGVLVVHLPLHEVYGFGFYGFGFYGFGFYGFGFYGFGF